MHVPEQSTWLDAALSYMARGWRVIDLPPGTKNPGRPGWQYERYDEETIRRRVSNGPRNLSVLLGEPSGGLVDVDLDSPEARLLAHHFLPPTAASFGRTGSPHSHRLYVADPVPEYDEFIDPQAPNEERAMLVELRSTGYQTVFPPSTHPTGETIEWEQAGIPARLPGDEIAQAVGALAAGALLARHWNRKNQRHKQSLALAGGLLRDRFSKKEAESFIGVLAQAAGDDSGKRGRRTLRRPPRNWRRESPSKAGPRSAS